MAPIPEQIRVALVDDDIAALKKLVMLLNRHIIITVCGEFQSVAALVAWLEKIDTPPEVIILDAEYRPGTPSIGALIRQIRRFVPNVIIICLSQYGEPQIVQEAAAAGANGFLLKTDIQMAIAAAVIRTYRGHFTYTQGIEPALRGKFERLLTRRGRIERWQWHPELTPRLVEVAQLCFLDGFSAPEASLELGTADSNVERYKNQIISILAVGWWHDRIDLDGLENTLIREQWSRKEGRMIIIRGQLWAFHILTQPPRWEALHSYSLQQQKRNRRGDQRHII